VTVTYRTGYGTTRRTLTELKAWFQFAKILPEVQRRLIAVMDLSHRYGRDVGIGGGFRSSDSQLALFLDRHYQVASGGCCGYNGRRYALKSGMAHAAPPGLSYHEETINGLGLAVDLVGWEDGWVEQQLAAHGLRSFSNLSGSAREPWHVQPVEVPTSRASYDSTVHIVTVWPLPASTAPDPVIPTPTLKVGSTGGEVYELQQHLTFWRWYGSAIDGSFGPVTADAVKRMQATVKVGADGVYGPVTANAYLAWLKSMQGLA
jgi:hypothetical protein